jgi:hypothetical protein
MYRRNQRDHIAFYTALFVKAVLSSSNSNNQLHSCRLLMLNSVGQSSNKDQAGLCLFGVKCTQEEAREKDFTSLLQ